VVVAAAGSDKTALRLSGHGGAFMRSSCAGLTRASISSAKYYGKDATGHCEEWMDPRLKPAGDTCSRHQVMK
jgi:hypothetical protein